jgi:ferredoxin
MPRPTDGSTLGRRPGKEVCALSSTNPATAGSDTDPALSDTGRLRVSIDQDLCTGDGLCVQYAPDVFEFDIDGLAYVKTTGGDLLTQPGDHTEVPEHLRLEVIDAARECPGECIHVRRAHDGVEVAGPQADD